MAKSKDYMIPIILVISIFAVWLALQYLPSDIFGTVWADEIAPMLWIYLPWLIILGVATFTLLYILRRR